MTEDDIKPLKAFTDKYPDWWYKIGVCSLSRDFDCAPERNAKESEYVSLNNVLTEAIHATTKAAYLTRSIR